MRQPCCLWEKDSHSVIFCCHTDISCRNFLSVGKVIYSNHSMSHVRRWMMVYEARDKLDRVLCLLSNLTAALYMWAFSCSDFMFRRASGQILSEQSHMLSFMKRFLKNRKLFCFAEWRQKVFLSGEADRNRAKRSDYQVVSRRPM